MLLPRSFAIAIFLAAFAPSFAAAAKPKPAKKFPPAVTVKDLALREARTCDTNRNDKIDAQEMTQLRLAQSKNPKSYLYLFDNNGNNYLDDSEIAKISLKPEKPRLIHADQPKKKKKK